ncbi:MAG: DUF285 domain-containing protein, partial [Methylococcales symbiont of Iophon sp. n. MRB-2018]
PLDSFITVWQMAADDLILTFPSEGSYSINWGDGTTQAITANNPTHTYTTAGDYIVTTSNAITRFYLNNGADKEKLIDIQQWGSANWTSMARAFSGASAMTMSASDSPDLGGVTDMSRMFSDASAFNQDIGGWNVANVTDMSRMFFSASAFNQDIGSWNVARVTDMSRMFFSASAFNQDIGGWNVARVTSMGNMFSTARAFNQDIGDWNVARVTSMGNMFSGVRVFNQDIGDWNVARVTNMVNMFNGAIAFNQDIGSWNVARVTNMTSMFAFTRVFDQDIGDWNVARVTDMSNMFEGASAFNQDIGSWNVARVTGMSNMFDGAGAFNQDIGDWNVDGVTGMSRMFNGASAFNQDIGDWNVANVTDMSFMFANANRFNQDIGGWNVGRVTNMTSMFDSTDAFSQNLGRWYVDETVDNAQGMLQIANPDYNGVDNLNVLSFNFVPQNTFLLVHHSPSYALAASGTDNAKFTLVSNALRFKSGMAADGIYSVRIAVGNADFGSSNSIELIIVADSVLPTVTSIVRTSPTDRTTNADTLIWTLTFSENVQNVDVTDFTVSGTTAALAVTGSGAVYQLSVTGGDLARLNGTVTLAFADDQNIVDLVDKALITTRPTGDNQP